jgi:signal transduction histidine kinase
VLIANCSHELRTPLARIRLGLDRVSEPTAKASDEIARSIAELDALIGEMLLSSRLDVAQVSNAPSPSTCWRSRPKRPRTSISK